MGRSAQLGSEGGRSKQKFRCRGCNVTPRGCDLRKHYKCNVNFDLLKLLKAAVGAADLQKLKDRADKHTLFFFDRDYSKERLPSWQTHTEVKDRTVGGSEAGPGSGLGGQQSLVHFLKVFCIVYFVVCILY